MGTGGNVPGASEERWLGSGRQNDNARLLAELLRRRETPLPCTHEDRRDLWFSEAVEDREAAQEVCRVCPMRSACPAAGTVKIISYGF